MKRVLIALFALLSAAAAQEPVRLAVLAFDTDDAAAFANVKNNLSSRATTDASAAWAPGAWNTVGQAGFTQRACGGQRLRGAPSGRVEGALRPAVVLARGEIQRVALRSMARECSAEARLAVATREAEAGDVEK